MQILKEIAQPTFTCSNLTTETLEKRCKICSKLLCHCRRSIVFVVNIEHISHLVLVFLLLALNMQLLTGH